MTQPPVRSPSRSGRHSRSARKPQRRARSRRRIAHIDRAHLHPKRWRHGLDGAELGEAGGYGRIPKDPHPRHAWRDLLEHLQPFAARAVFIQQKTGGVASRRARLSTKPAPTGSTTTGNTIGTVRVACSNGPTAARACARMTSGESAANSPRVCECRRHWPWPSGCRSACCGRWSSPIAPALVGTPRGGPAIPYRRRLRA